MKPQQIVPVPERMEHLPLDHRGYPVPFNVAHDKDGKPLFAVNNPEKEMKCLTELRCPICGGDLHDEDPNVGMWFVGGPLSALVPGGSYLALPGHEECTRYAMKVCPYMAAPRYGAPIGMHQLPEGMKGYDPSTPGLAQRPAVHVRVHAFSYSVSGRQGPVGNLEFILTPIKPFIDMDFWRHGEKISKREAQTLIRAGGKNRD